tara:strand:- start:70 stop:261 length:192 start_codon:yes stop_codon:yes gene_type:complete
MNLEKLVGFEVTLSKLKMEIRSDSALYGSDELRYITRRLDDGLDKLNEVIGKEFVKNRHKIEF